MMTNLFSIFDPSTPSFLSSNWLSSLIWLLTLPLSYWVMKNRFLILFTNLMNYIINEFKPLIQKTPYILIIPFSLFTFIMMNNVPGLLPYIFTASSHLTFSVTFALPIWLGIVLYGWLNNTSNLLIHLIPQSTPMFLSPFMVLIETVSNLIRPITLAVRLTANMIAGHLLVTLLSSASLITPFILNPLLSTGQYALMTLEVAVAFIQAYVFSVLMTLYTAETLS